MDPDVGFFHVPKTIVSARYYFVQATEFSGLRALQAEVVAGDCCKNGGCIRDAQLPLAGDDDTFEVGDGVVAVLLQLVAPDCCCRS